MKTQEYKLKRLVDRLIFEVVLNWNPHAKPGEAIQRLSPSDRELLKDAKPKHFYHRFP